jgi:hypothetical protein
MGDSEEFLKSQLPLFKAEQMKAPGLLGQGRNDSRSTERRATRSSGPCGRMAEMSRLNVTEPFLAKFLGGRSEPPTAEEATLLESVQTVDHPRWLSHATGSHVGETRHELGSS